MKKIIFKILMLVSVSSHAAIVGVCKGKEEIDYNYQNGLREIVTGDCEVKTKNEHELFSVIIEGYGLGLQFAASEEFVVTCPTVKFENLIENPFFGLKVGVTPLLGVDVGVFSNKKGGICFLTGFKNGIGIGFSGAKLEFGSLYDFKN